MMAAVPQVMFYGVHSIETDSHGNIFVTETYEGKRVQKFVYRGMGPAPSGSVGVVRPECSPPRKWRRS